ncbi:DUF4233 domain-containing protein [Blastococcus sp. SYSU DS0619]
MTAPEPLRAAKALRGAAAAVLVLEGIAVLFVPRAIAQTEGGLGGRLWVLLGLAVVLILASGIQRRERGLVIGTALQLPLLLTGLYTNAMWFVAGAFLLIWIYLLQVRKQLLGTAFGPVRAPDPADGAGGPTATP